MVAFQHVLNLFHVRLNYFCFSKYKIIIEVYKGTARDPSADTLVGTAIFGEEWDGVVDGTENSIRVLQYPGGVECSAFNVI